MIKRRPTQQPKQKQFFQWNARGHRVADRSVVHHFCQAFLDRQAGRISKDDFEKVVSGVSTPVHEHDIRPKLVKTGRVEITEGPMYGWKQYEISYTNEICSCSHGEIWLPDKEGVVELFNQIFETICTK